ncbi:hypothetical protein [Bacteroides sp. 519]|uniref:hypothetical protein n=1 Tax=Bacteroides sp. 519 TaxID=2302937 RepID=UPI0013D1B38D|nr:hypothetical protein [Bacteroides sp. 519]NDV57370.1 hypothetical protein [Bacteroides sp. 519]
MEQTKKKNGIAAVIIGVILSYLLSTFFFKTSVEEKLAKWATNINKTCPTMVDEFTQIDSVAVPKGSRTIKYYYSISNIDEENLDLDIAYTEMREVLLNGIKTSSELKILKDNDVTFDYLYFNKNREKLMEISISPAEYK